jgi:hypothetical protein
MSKYLLVDTPHFHIETIVIIELAFLLCCPDEVLTSSLMIGVWLGHRCGKLFIRQAVELD